MRRARFQPTDRMDQLPPPPAYLGVREDGTGHHILVRVNGINSIDDIKDAKCGIDWTDQHGVNHLNVANHSFRTIILALSEVYASQGEIPPDYL